MEQTLNDGSVLTVIDADTVTQTPPPVTIKISDLQAQLDILTARLQQVSDNYDAGKAAALAPIQAQIDAINAQLGSAQTLVTQAIAAQQIAAPADAVA